MPKLACPTCGSTLTVSDNAPAKLVCPRCLRHVENPHANDLRRPLPVMPLEYEVRAEQLASGGWIVAAMVLLALGAFGLLVSGRIAVGILIASGVVAISVVLVATPALKRNRRAVLGDRSDESGASGRTLQYQRPASAEQQASFAMDTVGMFIAGVVVGPIAVVGAAIFTGAIMGSLKLDPMVLLAALASVPVAGIVLACFPRTRAFGAGLLVGIGGAALILGSICGGLIWGLSR
jgi:hypothetical protein